MSILPNGSEILGWDLKIRGRQQYFIDIVKRLSRSNKNDITFIKSKLNDGEGKYLKKILEGKKENPYDKPLFKVKSNINENGGTRLLASALKVIN